MVPELAASIGSCFNNKGWGRRRTARWVENTELAKSQLIDLVGRRARRSTERKGKGVARVRGGRQNTHVARDGAGDNPTESTCSLKKQD
jgi:hypothetical protein